jgi:hypothetical protein
MLLAHTAAILCTTLITNDPKRKGSQNREEQYFQNHFVLGIMEQLQ